MAAMAAAEEAFDPDLAVILAMALAIAEEELLAVDTAADDDVVAAPGLVVAQGATTLESSSRSMLKVSRAPAIPADEDDDVMTMLLIADDVTTSFSFST